MRALFTFVAFVVTLAATAQQITEKGILGSWPVASIKMSGTILDFENNKVTLSDEKKKGMTQEAIKATEEAMLGGLGPMRSMRIEFADGGKIVFGMEGMLEEDTYTAIQREGKLVVISPIFGTPGSEVTVYPDRIEATQVSGGNTLYLVFKKKKN